MVRTQREPEGKKEPSEIKETREKERRGEEKPRVRLGEEREREKQWIRTLIGLLVGSVCGVGTLRD